MIPLTLRPLTRLPFGTLLPLLLYSWYHACNVSALMLPAEELQAASDRVEARRHPATHFPGNKVFDFVTVDVTPLAARRSEQLAPPAGAVSGVCSGPKRNSRGIHGNCESTSSSGSYDTVLSGIDTLQACARICAGCASCRYVSFSLKHHECAWFAQCDMSRLQRWPDGYHTMQIQGTAALL